jgi:hypothetical protein
MARISRRSVPGLVLAVLGLGLRKGLTEVPEHFTRLGNLRRDGFSMRFFVTFSAGMTTYTVK